jgi:arginase
MKGDGVARITVPYYIGDPLPALLVTDGDNLKVDLEAGTPQQRMVQLFEELAAWVAATERPVVHAADCMAPLAVVAGLQRAGIRPHLIWLDAHGDFNTWETTPSGYLGGMPVAMLVGRGEQTIIQGLGIRPLAEEMVTLADARDLDPGEAAALAGSRVRIMSIAEIATMALPDAPIHVHLDVDVIDPDELPGLLYPAPGGPTAPDLVAALRHLASAPGLAAISIAHTYSHDAGSGAAQARRLADALIPAAGW